LTGNFAENGDFQAIVVIFTMTQRLRKWTDDFTSPPINGKLMDFCPKIPTASTMFEPVISGIKDQRGNLQNTLRLYTNYVQF
jgi:hypothetical protein